MGRGRRRPRQAEPAAFNHEHPTQRVGRAASSNASSKKQMRGRPGGFGRLAGRPSDRKLGQRGSALGQKIAVRFMGKVRFFSKRASLLHGVGLFAEGNFKKGEVFGYFTGELLTPREGARRRRQGAKSIIQYSVGAEGDIFIDASRGLACPFQWINSSVGSEKSATVQFVVIGDRLCVEARVATTTDDELLADYRLCRAR